MFVLRFLTAGESHGPCLTGILDGVPAGLALTEEQVNIDLRRRQGGYGRSGRQKIEKDQVEFLGGVAGGRTTGGPIALRIENRDWKNWQNKVVPPMTIPRPGHADLAGALKYRHTDLRLVLERASARETAMRVAVGAIARRLLDEFGIIVASQVLAIGEVTTEPSDLSHAEVRARVEASPVRVADPGVEAAMIERIDQARRARDTVGGICSIEAFGVPAGLGSYVQWDRKLDGRLAQAVMSIQAIKGVEIGSGFAGARMPGSEFHDAIFLATDGSSKAVDMATIGSRCYGQNMKLHRISNNAGGLEGGVTNGQPIVVRMAMKPISTMLRGMASVDLATGEETRAEYQRSDICAVPAAAVVGEAMIALVLADAFLEKYGGDSIDEIKERYTADRSVP
jgi:chorismate synthase